jgi:hypothetical protein
MVKKAYLFGHHRRNCGDYFGPPRRLGAMDCSAEKPSNAIQGKPERGADPKFLREYLRSSGSCSANGGHSRRAILDWLRSPFLCPLVLDKWQLEGQSFPVVPSLFSSRLPYACGVIRRHISLPLANPFNSQNLLVQLFPNLLLVFIDLPLSSKTLKWNFTTSGNNGTITKWDGTKGTLQSDTATK